jgi:hypothetical protein
MGRSCVCVIFLISRVHYSVHPAVTKLPRLRTIWTCHSFLPVSRKSRRYQEHSECVTLSFTFFLYTAACISLKFQETCDLGGISRWGWVALGWRRRRRGLPYCWTRHLRRLIRRLLACELSPTREATLPTMEINVIKSESYCQLTIQQEFNVRSFSKVTSTPCPTFSSYFFSYSLIFSWLTVILSPWVIRSPDQQLLTLSLCAFI